VLFADLTGYTRLAASLDPEEVYSFLRPTMAELQRITEEFGGSVPQVMGDGFMAVFGVPLAHEDDAERAVRAALALRDHVRELNAEEPELPFPDVHAGVNSGEVMVAPADEQAGFRIVGDTVNVASRIADLATAGRVLVDQHTVDLTSHAISYGPQRRKRAKGLADPLPTYEALSARSVGPSRRRGKAGTVPFIDRDAEIARLQAEARSAERQGRSRVLVVKGEPGLGKSRLAEEFATRGRPSTVLMGRCKPFGQRRPLDPFGEALSGAIGPVGASTSRETASFVEELAIRVAGTAPERVGLVRDLRILLGIERPRGRRPDALEGLARAGRAVIEDRARQGLVLMLIDDLHWADPDLLTVIEDANAGRWIGPILLVGTSRTEGVGTELPSIELHALEPGNSRELAEEVLGSDLPPHLLGGLVRRSGGNPLFLEESIGMLIESGAIVRVEGRWHVVRPQEIEGVPSAIRRLIAARLDGLPSAEKRILQDASVAGQAVWLGLLEHLGERIDRRAALRALEARDLLRRTKRRTFAGETEYVFKHVLIREVAYDSIPKAERARTHLEIAGWLRERAPEDAMSVAHHYESAWRLLRTRTGPPPPQELAALAVRYLRRCADESFAYQARTAEALYARALHVAEATGSDIDDAELARLLIGRSEALAEMVRRREAVEHATRAYEFARRSGERELQGRALLARGRSEGSRPLLQRALALFEESGDIGGQGWALLGISETWADEDYRHVLDYQGLAYELLSAADQTVGRILVAQSLAYLLTVVGGAEFRRWYAECRRLATNEGDLRSRAELLRTKGYFEHYRGRHREAIRVMQEARPVAVEAGDRYTEADTLVIEAMATACVGPQNHTQQLADAAIRMGREMESDRVVALGELAGARAAMRSGRPIVARRRLTSAVKLLQPPTRLDILDAHLVAAQVHLDRGSWTDVERSADELRSGVLANGWRLWEPLAPLLAGRARLAAGDPEGALPNLQRAVMTARSAGATGTLPLARAVRDQAGILSGRQPRATAAAGEPEDELAAILFENRGLLSLRSRRGLTAASDAFGAAAHHWQRLGASTSLARSLSFRAEAERRAGNRRRASRLANDAERVLDSLNTPEASRGSLRHPSEAETVG
jgi:class 3 adenylate cyclase/tetratricopeptide (TPR) repeat protein